MDAPTKHGNKGTADPASRNSRRAAVPRPSAFHALHRFSAPLAGTLSTACEGTLSGWSVITPDPGTVYECRWTND